MIRLHTTPASDGFHMPAEFEKHYGCIMIWPERADSWSYGGYAARRAFAQVAEAISRSEKVIVCAGFSQYQNARQMLSPAIRVVEMSSNDAWARDYSPVFVRGAESLKPVIRGIDFNFNAWGGLVDGLYFPWDKDNAMALKLCDLLETDCYDARDFTLEGGSIHVDGEGTAITTETCLLSAGRNPSMTKDEIEDRLREYLGVRKILWLPCGIYNDETNEHVDNICAFTAPGHVVLTMPEDTADVQYAMSMHCVQYLQEQTDAAGRPITIHYLPAPHPVFVTEKDCAGLDNMDFEATRTAGERLAASYVNFYIANGAVVVPAFAQPDNPADPNHKTDAKAKRILSGLFPDREIIPVYARDILLGGGNIHCITMQIPI